MLIQQLTLSYECLNAIGNSLLLEEMIEEVLHTFSRKTGAVSASYFQKRTPNVPLFHSGKNLDVAIDIALYDPTYAKVIKVDEFRYILLPLRKSYFVFCYKNRQLDLEFVASIFTKFIKKIDMAIDSCYSVKRLQGYHQELENLVDEGIQKIHENEKMIISQSKQAVMGEMLEMIAHQWRQPLTSIGMISNTILFDLALGENIDKTNLYHELNTINIQVAYLSKIIDDFRDFFKPRSTPESTSLCKIFDESTALVNKLFESKGIALYVQDDTEDLSFITFKNELIQVLINLLNNAKDALLEQQKEEAKIDIRAYLKYGQLIIEVEDNAGGIDPTIQEHIFEPYFSTKKEKNGTGLGLYMSKIIVAQHLHGNITQKNTDSGACFTIAIDLQQGRPNANYNR